VAKVITGDTNCFEIPLNQKRKQRKRRAVADPNSLNTENLSNWKSNKNNVSFEFTKHHIKGTIKQSAHHQKQ